MADAPEPEDRPEADFGATVRYMAVILGTVVALALILGWFLSR